MERDWRQEPDAVEPFGTGARATEGRCVTGAAPDVCPFTDISWWKKILLFSVTSLCLCGMNFSENCQKFQLELIYFDLIEVKAGRVLPLFSAAFWVRSPVATKPLFGGYALLKKSKECEWAGLEWAELVPKIEDHFNSFTSVILWILEWNFTGRWLLMWSLKESLGPGP